jgi:hypothetical protein
VLTIVVAGASWREAVMAESHQLEIALPRRTRDDYLGEQLAAAIEKLNATTDAAERVGLFAEVERLRAQLATAEDR